MEILAPAGSIAALKAAIKGGADAVYLGLGEHNARIKSNDFNTQNLSEWVSYAHLFGVKVYVTLNTAVKQGEIERVISLAEVAARSGADALIVADLGLASILSRCTDIPLHLSTQAGVQNSLDVQALSPLRIKRLILARETPISDLGAIKKLGYEIEVFAQGAMCVCFSGGCLLGSKIYGASGNRGVCNQACRMTYVASDESGREIKRGKLLSPYDLCRGGDLDRLAEAGVDSIKIEGRLKRPAYVYAATRYYRALLNGADASEAYRDLCESFHRGFTKGYSLKKSDKIINTMTSAHVGVRVGKIVRVIERGGYLFAYVKSEYPFVKGDGAKILRDGVEVGGSDITSVVTENGLYRIPVSAGVQAGDDVSLTTNIRKVREAESVSNKRPVRLTLSGAVGEKLTLTADCGDLTLSVQSESIAVPSNSADNAALSEKISKIGGTDFSLVELSDRTKQPLFLPIAEVNAMRRDLFADLRELIIRAATPKYRFADRYTLSSFLKKGFRGRIIETDGAEIGCVTGDAYVLNPHQANRESLTQMTASAGGKPCYLRLPKILREGEISYYRALLISDESMRVYADTLYAVSLARELGRGYIAGFGLNIFNAETAALFEDADYVCASIEDGELGDTLYVAGKVPLMSFAHCPFSVVYGGRCDRCKRDRDVLFYSDGDHRYLIRRCEGVSCSFTMYEDAITKYPANEGKNRFYSFVGLNQEEKRAMMKYISEDIGE